MSKGGSDICNRACPKVAVQPFVALSLLTLADVVPQVLEVLGRIGNL